MENSKGLVTIPTDLDVVPETLELMKRWGADAIRDCDGTDFPEALKDADAEIYSTYYTTRKDNEWAKANPEEIQQMYLMTPFYTADSESLSIEIMKGLYPDMLSPNTRDDIKRWWEVVDRTTGKVVPTDEWDYNEEEGKVTIIACDRPRIRKGHTGDYLRPTHTVEQIHGVYRRRQQGDRQLDGRLSGGHTNRRRTHTGAVRTLYVVAGDRAQAGFRQRGGLPTGTEHCGTAERRLD